VPTVNVALSMLSSGAVDAVMGDDLTISMALMQGVLKEGVKLAQIDTEVPPFQLPSGRGSRPVMPLTRFALKSKRWLRPANWPRC
jgi:ABC-type amino acid transport substrate-binding protein